MTTASTRTQHELKGTIEDDIKSNQTLKETGFRITRRITVLTRKRLVQVFLGLSRF